MFSLMMLPSTSFKTEPCLRVMTIGIVSAMPDHATFPSRPRSSS